MEGGRGPASFKQVPHLARATCRASLRGHVSVLRRLACPRSQTGNFTNQYLELDSRHISAAVVAPSIVLHAGGLARALPLGWCIARCNADLNQSWRIHMVGSCTGGFHVAHAGGSCCCTKGT